MLTIKKFICDNLAEGCVTDGAPVFSYYPESDENGTEIAEARLSCNGWSREVSGERTGIAYGGEPLKPFTDYAAVLFVRASNGEETAADVRFATGRLGAPWRAKWITDGTYRFTEKKTSPVPLTFQKTFRARGKVTSAKIYATALGIYELTINGEKAGKDYFAPGFTSYAHQLQYQVYDVTDKIGADNTLTAVVAGGWAVGAFVFTRVNRVSADRQAFLAELRLTYEDGSQEIIGTDTDWLVTREGKLRFAEFYDGEVYDASIAEADIKWHPAAIEKPKISPDLIATYGSLCTAHEVLKPVSVCRAKSGELIYDFGQNFAGVVRFRVKGKAGQQIIFRHAEVLTKEGELNTAFLRSAKCRLVYTCKEGEQTYSPRMTYMGFRYAGVSGVNESDIEMEAVAVYSDVGQTGSFTCSDEDLNRLQSNILWSGKSNFVDIPTDCPQRDERMGWTGDIALFAPTACFNFDMTRFLRKWLKDVKSEQTRGGGIPNTVPVQGYGFPATMPKKAIAFWGDACIYVPWVEYQKSGDLAILKTMYPVMKKYVKACRFWAGLFSFGKNKYIWNDIPALQFGDWVAPDVPEMGQWQARSKWTATAALCRAGGLLAEIAALLGEKEDEKTYRDLAEKTADAYVSVFTDGDGKLKDEFQTAYVLPLYFGMFPKGQRQKAAANLAALVQKADYCIGTGFPGTPYLLFALADNGHEEEAFRMLFNKKCPSWLYEVKAGATTIWERWDGLDENGVCRIGEDGTGGMVSFNHYAFGAVGDFLYRRVCGIEPKEGGYKRFEVAPLTGGGLTFAKAETETGFGMVGSEWKKENGVFTLTVRVPVGAECLVKMPSGATHTVRGGVYTFSEQE